MKALSSLRPRYASFEDAGLNEAFQRGFALLGLKKMEFWLGDFDHMVFELLHDRIDLSRMFKVVSLVREKEAKLRAEIAELLTKEGLSDVAECWKTTKKNSFLENLQPLHRWSATGVIPETRMALSIVRLSLGSVVEAAFARAAIQATWHGKTSPFQKTKIAPETWSKTPDGRRQISLARIYNDSALVAVFTSAHAMFIQDCQGGILEAPSPTIFTVPSSFTEYNFADLLTHRTAPKDKSIKAALPLLTLLMRALNTSTRGWDTLFSSVVSKSTALRAIVGRALLISAAGLHESVHPAIRQPWEQRNTAFRRVYDGVYGNRILKVMSVATSAARECVRRMMTATVSCMPAATRAFCLRGNPIRMLQTAPLCLPAPGLDAVGECFAAASRELVATDADVIETLARAFDQPSTTYRLKYDAGWLGKGTAPASFVTPYINIASEIFALGFKSHFYPLWLHAFVHGERIGRLEEVFYQGIHALNPVMKLVNMLSEKEALYYQRLAVTNVSSGLLGAKEVAELLKMPLAIVENPLQKIPGMDDEKHGKLLACCLTWARAAWLSDLLLIYDLGSKTTGKQVLAILRRLDLPAKAKAETMTFSEIAERKDELLVDALEQNTHLLACLSCGNTATPIVNDAKPQSHFCDVGASTAMNCTECEPTSVDFGSSHIRCAKRASAALRSAVIFEDDSEESKIETLNIDEAAVEKALKTASRQKATASGVGARAKRDAKTGFSQQCCPKGCGSGPLLSIPMLGRVISLKGVKYALCAFCGAGIQVQHFHRSGGEIACLKCDGRLISGFEQETKEADNPPQRVCRFCGRVETTSGTHRTMKAPFDVSGRNSQLPPPLREVSFCAAHQRSWLQQALRNLPTRQVLAHLAYGARPVIGASSKLSNEELGIAEEDAGPSRRGKKRKK